MEGWGGNTPASLSLASDVLPTSQISSGNAVCRSPDSQAKKEGQRMDLERKRSPHSRQRPVTSEEAKGYETLGTAPARGEHCMLSNSCCHHTMHCFSGMNATPCSVLLSLLPPGQRKNLIIPCLLREEIIDNNENV